jgi:hypothetical protein
MTCFLIVSVTMIKVNVHGMDLKGLSQISDAHLAGITAGDGVIVSFNNVRVYHEDNGVIWGDEDGAAESCSPGFIRVDGRISTYTVLDSTELGIHIKTDCGSDIPIDQNKTAVVIGIPELLQHVSCEPLSIILSESSGRGGSQAMVLGNFGMDVNTVQIRRSENAKIYITSRP